MRFDTQSFPLISDTTRIQFVDARMSEKKLQSQNRRNVVKRLAIALVVVVAFSFVIAHMGLLSAQLASGGIG